MSSSPPQQTPTTSSPWWSRPCRVGWILLRSFWVLIVIAIVPSTVVALVFLSQSTSFQSLYLWSVLDWMQLHLFMMLIILLVLVGLTWLTWYGSRLAETAPREQTSARAPNERDRAALLRLLGNEYRRQLTQSLQGAAMMELGLQERTDVISSPAQLVSWRLDAPEERSLPALASIVKAYDEASGGLLILGAPGAGKSTLLRELACDLLSRAEQDPELPITVLVNLSSWATKILPLETWLVEQLQVVYGLPRHLSKSWMEQDQFLFLLDGLDEVAASARPTCIDYINAYRGAHFVPLVVCSRSREYLTQAQRLILSYAVEVQPLTHEQVNDYLKRVGKLLTAARAVLRSNPVLHNLVTTPLMLSVVMLAYHGKTVKDLPHFGNAEEQQRQVFEHYVERVLEQQARNWHYTSQQTQKWLIWLAQQMQQHQLTEFYLERLQHTWLPTKRAQALYPWIFGLLVWLLVWLLGGLLVGLLFGLVFGLVFGLGVGLVFGLGVGLLFGLLFGLGYGLFYGGASFLNHYLIRFLLWRSGVIPLHYIRFLEEATERILLQRVGGGYRFIHPLFQEYFVSLGRVPPPDSVTPSQHL